MKFGWLHISDTHLEPKDDYGRDVVLGTLVAAVQRECSRGRAIDAIFVTGDIASRGSSVAYGHATSVLDELVAATGLSRARVFVVPGNHDVDRQRIGFVTRTLGSLQDSDRYFAPGERKYHFDRFAPYAEWHDEFFRGIRSFSRDSTCGPVEVVEVEGGRIGVLPINTALFSADDPDHEKLWIGRRCLQRAIDELKSRSPSITIVLMHHPLTFLNGEERNHINSILEDNVDIVLRGHLHESSTNDIKSHRGHLLHLAAGSAYQSSHYRKLVSFGRIEQEKVFILPWRYYEESASWHVDPTLFPAAPNNEGHFVLPRWARKLSVRLLVSPNGLANHVTEGQGGARLGITLRVEDLADRTAASVRNDDAVIDALMVLTGLSRSSVRRRLNRADGRVRLRNLFSRWPQAPQEAQSSEADVDAQTLGARTVASVRQDAAAIVALASLTGLGARKISKKLAETDGRFRVRTTFADQWPKEESINEDEEAILYSAEELASWTVAAARDDDDVLDAVVSITGRSLRKVRSDLSATDGRVHLRNLFSRWWPQPAEDNGASNGASTVGSLRVGSARGDAGAIAAIAALTGLGERTISSKLSQADGRFRVRTIFSHRWPDDEAEESNHEDEEQQAHYSPGELGEWTVAAARENDDALESLEVITGLSLRGVKRCLNGANGRALLRNVFAHRWPTAEDEQEEDQDDAGESMTYSAAELANWTVAAARGDDEAVQSLMTITGISQRWVRRHLNAANGKVRVGNLFSEHWPADEGQEGKDSDEDQYSAEELADWTAASARDDEDAIDAITVITGISRGWVRRHLNSADGRTRIRNVFASYWPDTESTDEPDATKLGSCTIASIRRDPSLLADLCIVTGMTQRAVSRRVEACDGRFRARTTFQDVWPADDSGGRSDEGQRYSADELGEWTVAAARDDDGVIDSLVAITGLHPRWVRRHLNGADGRMLVRNLFAHRWPPDGD